LPFSKENVSQNESDEDFVSDQILGEIDKNKSGKSSVDNEEKTDVTMSNDSNEISSESDTSEHSIKGEVKTSLNIKTIFQDKKKLIRIIIVSLVLFLLAFDFIFPEKDTKSKKMNVEKIPKDEKGEKKSDLNKFPKIDLGSEVNNKVSEVSEVNVDTTNDINQITENNEGKPSLGESHLETSEPKKNDQVELSEVSEIPKIEEKTNAATDLGQGNTDTTDAVPDLPENITESNDQNEKSNSESDDKFTQDILSDLEKQAKESKKVEGIREYVTPPNYEYVGRGLVYNCTGKHWACVDAPSYKSCEDNLASVKYLKKKIECRPYSVYDSIKNCENMQNRMVSSSTKTNFCDE
jgi:hypothetical protein